MFRSLSTAGLKDEDVFSVKIASNTKPTMAKWHLNEPADLINTLALL